MRPRTFTDAAYRSLRDDPDAAEIVRRAIDNPYPHLTLRLAVGLEDAVLRPLELRVRDRRRSRPDLHDLLALMAARRVDWVRVARGLLRKSAGRRDKSAAA